MSWISLSCTDHVSGIELDTRKKINNKIQSVNLGVLNQDEVYIGQDKRCNLKSYINFEHLLKKQI